MPSHGRSRALQVVGFSWVIFLLCATAAVASESSDVLAAFSRLPLGFERDHRAFLARASGYVLQIDASGAALATGSGVVRLRLPGANRSARGELLEPLAGRINTYAGADSLRWKSGAALYSKLLFSGVWRGIDLVYYGNQRQLEFDFLVAPGADPRAIALRFDGAEGLELDADGSLVIRTSGEMLRLERPVITQGEKEVAGGFELRGRRKAGFRIGSYDRTRPLVIDPVLVYSTYLGGRRTDSRTANDSGLSVAVDGSGNAYVAGFTNSTNFPTRNALQGTYASLNCSFSSGGAPCSDAFVTKFSATGSGLVYSTYLGGPGPDSALGIAVDSNGNAYITGAAADNFPTTPGAFQTSDNRGAFVTKLDPNGALVYSTYLGGSSSTFEESGAGIAVDGSGNAYIAGWTDATNFPIAGTAAVGSAPGGLCNKFTPVVRSCTDAFATIVNPTGTALVYSTYLGVFEADDRANAVAIDSSGNLHVTGFTNGTTFQTARALQPITGGKSDAFITKIDRTSGQLAFSTYFGGSDDDIGTGIALDSSSNVWVTGTTKSTNLMTTTGALQTQNAGSIDGFMTKLNSSGSTLLYSTYLGGSGNDNPSGVAVDASGSPYVAGATGSANFPVSSGVFQASRADCNLYTSLDGGANWACSNSGIPYRFDVNAIVADPSDPMTLYAATGRPDFVSDGMYKSTDGGVTWAAIKTGLPTTSYGLSTAIDPSNPSVIYVGLGGFYSSGVYKSTDRGGNWSRSSTGVYGNNIAAIAIDPSSTQTVYACNESGVFKSTDGGGNWTQARFYNCRALAYDRATSTVWAANNSNSVIKSTDGGTTWILGSASGPISTIHAIAIHPTTSSTVLLGATPAGISRTTNGSYFPQSNSGLTNTNVTSLLFDTTGSVYAGTNGGGVFSSPDGGVNWSPRNGGLVNTAVQALGRGGASSLYAGAIGGDTDGFLTKVDPTKSGAEAIAYSTYFGGSGNDAIRAIAIDSTGKVVLTGSTSASNFPLASAIQSVRDDAADAFVAKLNLVPSARRRVVRHE